MKLWISESEFVEVDKDHESLAAEIAPRSRSLDWLGITGFLPDPDEVLRKLGQDMTVYRRLLTDAHVWSCYLSRKAGTLSLEWEIRESSQGSKGVNTRAYQMIKDMMENLDVYQILSDMLDAPFFGMSPIEIMWKSTGSTWLPERVIGKPPEWFVFSTENELRFQSMDNMIEGEELPEYKFLLPRHHATYQNPYGERTLSRCFWPVAFKKGGFKFWAIFTEKFGMPWIVGKVPRGTNETERANVLAKLASMVQDAVAVVNDDESVAITEASGKSASAAIYEKLISASNREVSKAVLGQTLSTEIDKGGSYAATKGHLEVRADIVSMDKRMVTDTWNLFFKWVTDLNFADAAPPKFAFYEEEDVQKDKAERDDTLTKQGVRFTKKYYGRTYNIEDDEFELGEPISGGSMGQFAENSRVGEDLSPGDTLDALGDKTLTLADFGDLMGPVEKLLGSASSLEEFRDGLLDLYGDMDESALGDLMQRALTVADLAGRFDV